MVTNLSPSSEVFLANMERLQQQVAEAGRQMSSGKKISVASDAPDQIESLLQLRANLARNDQIKSNLALAKTETDTADSVLNSATKLMDRAQVLGVQGGNFTLDAAGRQSIATEVQSLLEQMVAVSRTTVQGRFIFSGDQDSSLAYTVDLTAPNGVIRLSSAPSTRQVEDPAGGSFAASLNAQSIFDNRNPDDSLAPDNIFAALNGLRVALQNNDPVAVTSATNSLKLASDHLNTSEQFYGAVQIRIQDATSFTGSFDLQLRTELSQKEDADVTAAALELTQGTTHLQAAFQMQAKLPRTSLFDFLA